LFLLLPNSKKKSKLFYPNSEVNMHKRFHLKKTGLLNTLFASLFFGVPAIPLAASAQTRPAPSVCPGVYYEEPWNNTVITPADCPPNAVTEQFIEEGRLPAQHGNMSAQTAQPSQPEDRSDVIATITPTDGTVDVRVKNNTNALVQYQAIGYTDYVPLEGGEETVLRDVPLPATITFARQDDGFVKVMPISASTEGMLEVTLNEDAQPLDSNQGTLRIQEDGSVLLN
jgi:hypothetical protein